MKDQKAEHWPAFHCEWFARNQRWLVGMANLPIAGRWLRRRLGLRRDLPVTMLRPMAAHYALPDGQYVAEVYTTWQFSKLVYRAFKPLWWAIHYWDELIADRWMPELSYGFDELTAFTAAGYPVTNFSFQIGSDADGYPKANQGSNLSFFRDTQLLTVSQTVSSNPTVFSVNRFFLKFNLGDAVSGLPIRVSSATLDLAMSARSNVGQFRIQAFEATISDASVGLDSASDWTAFNSQGLFPSLGFQLSSYAITVDKDRTAAGFAQVGVDLINTKTNAFLKLCMRHSQDVFQAPPSISTSADFYSASGGAAPRVTLTYSRLINHSSLDSSITLGLPTITQANPQTVMLGIDSSLKLGEPTITQTNLPVQLDALDSSIVLGTPTIATVQLDGLDSSIVLGTPTIATMQLPAIDSLVELGAPFVLRTGEALASMTGIDSTITLGAPTVILQTWVVSMLGIDSSTTFGAPTIDSPYPDGDLYEGPYIARIIDQATDYGYSRYEFEDGAMEVNVQPIGNRQWQLEYTGLSAAEVAVLAGHYDGMRGRVTTFRFYHRRDDRIYFCRYVSMTLPSRQRTWANDVQVVLEALG